MKFFYFLFEFGKTYRIFNSTYIEPCFHNLLHGDISELNNSF